MKRIFFTLFGLAFLALGTNGMAHEVSTGEEAHDTVHLETIDIPEGVLAPRVTVTLTLDSVGGWNLHADAENFIWAPEHAGKENVMGEGHAHIYLDGIKIARTYGEWYHLPLLPEGEHTISVTLNGNGHQTYTQNGVPITGATTLVVNANDVGAIPMEEESTEITGNGTPQTVNQKEIIGPDAALPYLLLIFGGLALFAFAMGKYMSPGKTK